MARMPDAPEYAHDRVCGSRDNAVIGHEIVTNHLRAQREPASMAVRSAEPFVRTGGMGFGGVLLRQAGARRLPMVERGHIRFEVEQRRPVQHVDIGNGEPRTINTDQPNDGEADGVWPLRGARRPRSGADDRAG
jgi:hypothetical protein